MNHAVIHTPFYYDARDLHHSVFAAIDPGRRNEQSEGRRRAGYIPDDANWERMGAAFERGCAEPAIVNNLLELMKSTMHP
jgi:hypothetical protein